MFREKKRRRVRLPLRAYLMYITLLSFLLTGVTFSKYVTRSSSGDSARVARFGALQITESDSASAFVPGVNIYKDTSVFMDTTEVATYVFLTVAVTGFSTDGNGKFWYIGSEKIYWNIADGWTKLDNTGLVYYREVSPHADAQSFGIIRNSYIYVSSYLTEVDFNGYVAPTVAFKAYMVQAGGFTSAADAWGSIPH